MQKWMFAFVAPALPALLAGCVAHSTPSVPPGEVSAHSPDMLRELLSHRVVVSEYAHGHQFAGDLVARVHQADGRWRSCGIASGKSYSGRWTVTPDAYGRAAFSGTPDGYAVPRRTFVVRYDPGTGDIEWRRRGSGKAWVASSRGWLQDRWPQVAVDKCRGLNLRGLAVDSRQTGTTLAALRRQAPDAPLKNLAQPLPPPAGKQSAAPASVVPSGSGVASAGGAIGPQLPALTDEDRSGLVAMGVPERMLPAFEDQAITPALWAKLLEKGFTVEDIAAEASAPVGKRAQDYELRVVSVRDGVATLRSSVQDWNVREGDDVYTIGRVARITTDGDVWLQGMSEPLPRAAR